MSHDTGLKIAAGSERDGSVLGTDQGDLGRCLEGRKPCSIDWNGFQGKFI